MSLSTLLSSGTRELIERLRPHLDVTIELFDPTLAPVLGERRDSTSQLLRRFLDQEWTASHPSSGREDVRARALTAITTGSPQVFACAGLQIGCFPIRQERKVVGLLAAADLALTDQLVAWTPSQDDPPEGAGGRLERLCWFVRATIESDIDLHGRLSGEERDSRWLSSTLRLFEHLNTCTSERQMAHTLTHAVAIWGDVEARLYRRRDAQTFHLHTAVPELRGGPSPVLPASIVDTSGGAVRLTSIAELDQLGYSRHGEVLLLPVRGRGRPIDWVLVVAGVVAPRFERVLAAACGSAALGLEDIAMRRVAALQHRLGQRVRKRGGTVPSKLAGALVELASDVGARRARLVLRETDGQPARTLADVGGRMLEALATPHRWSIDLEVGLPAPAAVEFDTPSPLDEDSRRAVAEGASVFGTWLAGVLHGLAGARHDLEPARRQDEFEGRLREELERARRFGLTAGVVVIDTAGERAADPVAEAIRQELRASDVLGRLGDGQFGAILVQADAEGVRVAAHRLASRLAAVDTDGRHPRLAAVLGVASYPTGGETAQALVAAAREDQTRRQGARRVG